MIEKRFKELLLVCRRLIHDGVLLEDEVRYLNLWLQANPQVAFRFPGQQVAARLKRIYADGVVTEEERKDLLDLLRKATRDPGQTQARTATSVNLPFDHPAPEVHFMNRHFCLAGRFFCGSPRWCRTRIEACGGEVDDQPKPSTDYVVIGAAGDSDPNLLEKVAGIREKLKVISEEHWLNALRNR
ncbi:MAG: hypothetical protein FJ398_08845 [Verrucomicrobia bacterium]|nr:hypothetical protein [Verrucomicrobiota bacterium]